MPRAIVISVNLGAGFAGLNLVAQIIRPDGTNMTGLIADGFYEVGEGFYIWEYLNFPDNFRGGVKFYNQADTSRVLSFIDVTSEDVTGCTSNEECVPEIGETFDITYSDQPNLNFYALLFSAEDGTKAWVPATSTFETYLLSSHSNFVMPLVQDPDRLGWYEYTITNVANIPVVVGGQYYFVEVWQRRGASPDRTADLNTGTLRVCWGAQEGEWLEIARRVWEYGTRTLTDFNGITPQQIWEYSTRTLTEGGIADCDYTELEKHILAAIAISTGKTIEEIHQGDAALAVSIQKTFDLLKVCCAKTKGTPNIQTPRIGPRGSKGRNPDVRFK
jgi:hypothetical protein